MIPFFCFDPRIYNTYDNMTKFDTKKICHRRFKFQIESVKALRESLEEIGSLLAVSAQKPEDFI